MAEMPTPQPAPAPALPRSNHEGNHPAQSSLYVQGAGTCVECTGALPKPKGGYRELRYCGDRCRRRACKKRYWARRPGALAAKKRRLRAAEDPEVRRRYNRNRDLKLKYGMTLEQYEALVASQGGRCAVCREGPPEGVPARLRPLAVDHCHATGRVRGLLCFRCNVGIGHFRDKPGLLTAAMAYLATRA